MTNVEIKQSSPKVKANTFFFFTIKPLCTCCPGRKPHFHYYVLPCKLLLVIALSIAPITERLLDAKISAGLVSGDKLRLRAHRGAVTNRIIPFELIWGTKPPKRTKLEARVRKTSAQFRVSKEFSALVSWQSLTCPQLQEWVTRFWMSWLVGKAVRISGFFWFLTEHFSLLISTNWGSVQLYSRILCHIAYGLVTTEFRIFESRCSSWNKYAMA